MLKNACTSQLELETDQYNASSFDYYKELLNDYYLYDYSENSNSTDETTSKKVIDITINTISLCEDWIEVLFEERLDKFWNDIIRAQQNSTHESNINFSDYDDEKLIFCSTEYFQL